MEAMLKTNAKRTQLQVGHDDTLSSGNLILNDAF